MWSEIILGIFKLAAWWLDSTNADAAKKKKLFEFIRRAGQDHSVSKLMEYGDMQLKQLKETKWEETT